MANEQYMAENRQMADEFLRGITGIDGQKPPSWVDKKIDFIKSSGPSYNEMGPMRRSINDVANSSFVRTVNDWNPIASGVNLIYGATTGKNYYGTPMTGEDVSFAALGMIPGEGKLVEKIGVTIGKKLPMQIHHFATNKNKRFTPQLEKIAFEFGLNLNQSWNKLKMPHLGRHPNKYHEFVLRNMRKASDLAQGNAEDLIKYFNLHVKKPIIKNVELLRKSGWK